MKVKVFFNRGFNLLCSAFKRLYLYFECKCRINNGFQQARDVVSSILVQPYVAFLGSYVWWCGSSSAAWWSLMIPVCVLKSESHKACLHLETSFRLRKMPNWNVLKAVQVGFSQGFSLKMCMQECSMAHDCCGRTFLFWLSIIYLFVCLRSDLLIINK